MFVDSGSDDRPADHWSSHAMAFDSAEPVASLVPVEAREAKYDHKPLTILISGLSASGKTTLARQLEEKLFGMGRTTVLLDGQTMRSGISRDLGFSAEERSENLRRAAEVAKLLNDSGLVCIASFIAPHEDIRQKVKQLIGPQRFLHVHLSTPIQTCRERDQSGIYAAADRGELTGVAGVDREYETPLDADLAISTEEFSVNSIVEKILDRFGIHANQS